jgi:hypothetical protein
MFVQLFVGHQASFYWVSEAPFNLPPINELLVNQFARPKRSPVLKNHTEVPQGRRLAGVRFGYTRRDIPRGDFNRPDELQMTRFARFDCFSLKRI